MKDQTYRFKIRSSNFCRNGEYSDILGVKMDVGPPCQMEKVSSRASNCQVNFTWMQPCDGKSPIKKFNIAVMGIDKVFYPIKDCGDENNFADCTVAMSVFGAEPFNLKSG